MSKSKHRQGKERKRPLSPPDEGRRKLLLAGLGGAGTLAIAGIAGYKAGWFGSSSPNQAPVATSSEYAALPPATISPTTENAIKSADEYIVHYARELRDTASVSHAIISQGKKFALKDGTVGVDFLCSRFASEMEVNGKKYVYFPADQEAHTNSFLMAFLDCNVSLDQPIKAGNGSYTLRDLKDSARALFRCDPGNLQRYDPELLHRHLPWAMMALPTLVKPKESVWTNAYGEKIVLDDVIDSGLKAFERDCSGVTAAIGRGEPEPLPFRQEMSRYACFGFHMTYAALMCVRNGYTANNLRKRAFDLLDNAIYRMEGDPAALDKETAMASQYGQDYINNIGGKNRTNGKPPAQVIELMRIRYRILAVGHALEAVNYAKLHALYSFSPEQADRIAKGEKTLHADLAKLAAMDMAPFLRWYPKFVSDTVIAISHASRAMKLLTPANPDLA